MNEYNVLTLRNVRQVVEQPEYARCVKSVEYTPEKRCVCVCVCVFVCVRVFVYVMLEAAMVFGMHHAPRFLCQFTQMCAQSIGS